MMKQPPGLALSRIASDGARERENGRAGKGITVKHRWGYPRTFLGRTIRPARLPALPRTPKSQNFASKTGCCGSGWKNCEKKGTRGENKLSDYQSPGPVSSNGSSGVDDKAQASALSCTSASRACTPPEISLGTEMPSVSPIIRRSFSIRRVVF